MLPRHLQPFFWSSKITELDPKQHKKRIITNLLNFGDIRALRWLFKNYSRQEIKEMTVDFLPGEWSKKSLNFWRLFFNLKGEKVKEDKRLIK